MSEVGRSKHDPMTVSGELECRCVALWDWIKMDEKACLRRPEVVGAC